MEASIQPGNPANQPGQATKPESLFKNNNFLLLFSGKLVSRLGDSIYLFALTWFVLEKYGSPTQAGILMMSGLIPSIIVGPFAGVVADKFDRKSIIVWMDFLRGIIVFAVVGLLYYNMLNVWLLCVVAALLGLCGSLFNPACSAIIPNIVKVEHFAKANSLDTIIGSVSNIVGVLGGGILYSVMGFASICFVNAASFIISGIAEMFLKVPPKPQNIGAQNPQGGGKAPRKFSQELTAGYTFLRSKRGLHTLFLFFIASNFLLAPIYSIYLPYIFNKLLEATTNQLSYVRAAGAVGMIVGASIMPMFARRSKFHGLIFTGMWFSNILMAGLAIPVLPMLKGAFAVWQVILLYMVLATLVGFFGCFINIPIGVLFQKMVSDDVRGRVNALISTIATAAVPLGYLVGGFLAENVPMYLLVFGMVAILLIISGWMNMVKELREI